MISRYEAYVDGIALSSIHPAIYVEDIKYQEPNVQYRTNTFGYRDGAIIDSRYMDKSSATISFSLRLYDTVERQKVLGQINKWANGSALKTSDKEGLQLECVCDKYPVIGSAKKWTDILSVTFSAYAIPFWQDAIPTTANITGTVQQDGILRGAGSFIVPGNAGNAYCAVDVTAGSALTALSVYCGDTQLALEGVNIPAGAVVKFGYDKNGILRITCNGTSLLDRRTPISSDNLLAVCGKVNHIGFAATATAVARFSVRGCWL